MKRVFQAVKKGGKYVVTTVSLAAGSAMAAVPAAVSTAIDDTKTDAVTVAGLMIGVVAALLVFKYIRGQMR